MIKYVVCAIATMVLATAAVAIGSFDDSDMDIARPPSLDKLVPRSPSTRSSPSRDEIDNRQSNAARFIANPLDRYAVRQLAQDPAGDQPIPGRARLLLLAAERSFRDVELQSAAIDVFLKEEKYPQALERLDGLIRARPPIREKLYDVLAIFAQSHGSRAPLVELLGENPPWRKHFFRFLPNSSADTRTISALIAELRSSKSPPDARELGPFIGKLIAEGATDQAYALWLNSLSEAQLARAGYVYNGDFEAQFAEQGAFDWIVIPTKNVLVRAVPNNSAGRGRILEIAFADSQTAYGNLYQRLMLPPGRFTLNGSYKAIDLQNDRGLVWRISCETAPQQSLGESRPINGSQDWSPFDVSFSVPEKDCVSQLLRLQINARAKLDLRATGVLRFDGLRIGRQE